MAIFYKTKSEKRAVTLRFELDDGVTISDIADYGFSLLSGPASPAITSSNAQLSGNDVIVMVDLGATGQTWLLLATVDLSTGERVQNSAELVIDNRAYEGRIVND